MLDVAPQKEYAVLRIRIDGEDGCTCRTCNFQEATGTCTDIKHSLSSKIDISEDGRVPRVQIVILSVGLLCIIAHSKFGWSSWRCQLVKTLKFT